MGTFCTRAVGDVAFNLMVEDGMVNKERNNDDDEEEQTRRRFGLEADRKFKDVLMILSQRFQ